MSKRIIQNGIYNKTECACECIFAFDKEDVVEKDGKKIVTCPQCGADCEVKTK